MIKERLNRVTAALHSHEADVALFFDLPTIRYLCGFTGTDGALAVFPESTVFLTDSRYATQSLQQIPDEIGKRIYQTKLAGIADLLRERACQRIAFEESHLKWGEQRELAALVPALYWVPVKESFNVLRAQKTTSEVAELERAAGLHRAAFETIIPLMVPGTTERLIAWELEKALREAGGEDRAFDFIVASGERGALPHGVASDKVLQAGEMITVDFGTRVGGYYSDETVTIALGEISSRQQNVYDTVLLAHDTAIAALRPGVSLRDVDGIARTIIADAGFAEYFGHGLGHGVGLEVHEFPSLSPRSTAIAEPGMVVTVEPGIYLPGECGVRLEDMVLITEEGCRCLTSIPKTLRFLPV